MQQAYCLTALEAADMAGIELEDVMRTIAGHPSVAIQVGDAWRVDLDALFGALGSRGIAQAA